ncbi:hypothetical protein E2C01_013692 [Portunus trituberculatus]|uniref:Uncharacterized protein n=1 Tax=Portunus trituberculatus TaxID=210409 RepID=A0A5B7DHV1_PORTR|nr:hypothetical protein [Portunus trituberculatus]
MCVYVGRKPARQHSSHSSMPSSASSFRPSVRRTPPLPFPAPAPVLLIPVLPPPIAIHGGGRHSAHGRLVREDQEGRSRRQDDPLVPRSRRWAKRRHVLVPRTLPLLREAVVCLVVMGSGGGGGVY